MLGPQGWSLIGSGHDRKFVAVPQECRTEMHDSLSANRSSIEGQLYVERMHKRPQDIYSPGGVKSITYIKSDKENHLAQD